jgi:hypothetical protein
MVGREVSHFSLLYRRYKPFRQNLNYKICWVQMIQRIEFIRIFAAV